MGIPQLDWENGDHGGSWVMAACMQLYYRRTFLGTQLQCKMKETALFSPEL